MNDFVYNHQPATSFPKNELKHHGVKGQKWGVIRTPQQLGHEAHFKGKPGKGRHSEEALRARYNDMQDKANDNYKEAVWEASNLGKNAASYVSSADKQYKKSQKVAKELKKRYGTDVKDSEEMLKRKYEAGMFYAKKNAGERVADVAKTGALTIGAGAVASATTALTFNPILGAIAGYGIMDAGIDKNIGSKYKLAKWGNEEETPSETKKPQKGDVVIQKGSQVSHVSDKSNLKLKNSQTFVYNDASSDKEVYEGMYSRYIQWGKGASKVTKYKYEALNDLVAPSQKAQVKSFVETYRKDPIRSGIVLDYRRQLLEANMANGKKYNKDIVDAVNRSKKIKFDEKISDKDLEKYGYRFMTMLDQSGSKAQMITNNYNTLKSKGYNSLVDYNDKDVYNGAKLPLIVMDGKKNLKEVNKRTLTDKEISDNYEIVSKRNKKAKRQNAL